MRFHVDEDAQRVVVSIVDNKTGEVLRTVPSEAVLKVAKMIVQMQGQTVNTRA
jgi:flagellar protein FlaG